MGIFNRDYLNEPSSSWGGGGGFLSSLTPAVRWILIANLLVFIAQLFWLREEPLFQQRVLPRELQEQLPNLPAGPMVKVSVVQKWFELSAEQVLAGEVWRLITNTFCHARKALLHIVFNMLFLIWFGCALERLYGTREFAAFYFTAALVSSLAYIGLDLITGDALPAIGASGAIMAIMMVYAHHYPRQKILLFLVLPIEIRWLVLFYVIYDTHPVILALIGDSVHDGVAHAAHLGGLAFGLLYHRLGWKLFPRRTRQGAGPAARVAANRQQRTGRDPKLEAEVDRILRKVSTEGMTALTQKEQETLRRASQDYRER